MDKAIQTELKAHLMQTNETFRHLMDQHHEYDVLVEQLESKPTLSADEEIEIGVGEQILAGNGASELVVARFSQQDVVAAAAENGVVARSAANDIVDGVSPERVCLGTADEVFDLTGKLEGVAIPQALGIAGHFGEIDGYAFGRG